MRLQENQDSNHSQRNVGLGILLTWCLYILFVLLTDWKDYGLSAQAEVYLRWTIIRLSTVSIWLLAAALLIRYRKHPANWRSFIYSFVATSFVAMMISSSLVSGSVNDVVIAGSIVFYALVSGFMCGTVRKPIIAAILSILCFIVQFSVDATAHIFSGVFRFHF